MLRSPALRKVFANDYPPRVQPFEVSDFLLIDIQILGQDILNLPSRGGGEIHEIHDLVQYPPCVVPVRREMVRD